MANVTTKRRVTTTLIGIVIILALLGLSACLPSDIDGKYEGLSVGFNYVTPTKHLPAVVAVRSEQTKFAIDDVTLDFYIGWLGAPPEVRENIGDDEYYTMGFAIYVAYYRYEDEKIFYFNEIPADEFITDKYKVEMTKRGGKQFPSGKSYKLPKELFAGNLSIMFGYAEITYSKITNEKKYYQMVYSMDSSSSSFNVEYLSDTTVGLYN